MLRRVQPSLRFCTSTLGLPDRPPAYLPASTPSMLGLGGGLFSFLPPSVAPSFLPSVVVPFVLPSVVLSFLPSVVAPSFLPSVVVLSFLPFVSVLPVLSF